MSRNWEAVLTTWSQGPSETEQQKAANAESQVRQAIVDSPKLRQRDIKIFTQGSYRNRVNVRQDSDVDIGVLCFDTYFPDYSDDNVKTLVAKREIAGTYSYAKFKNEVEEALVDRFGRAAVTRGKKAFDVKANTYRVEADVVAFFEHRRWTSATTYHSGVEMHADGGYPSVIRNWPEQHYSNGVGKNDLTGRRYKRVVRILKHLRNEMAENGIAAAKPIPSFLIECLVWNVPNDRFDYPSFGQMVREGLAHLFNDTMVEAKCSEWGEVSELKYLFRGSQPWTWKQTHEFIDAAWNYMGFE
jgi:hypothetical protein